MISTSRNFFLLPYQLTLLLLIFGGANSQILNFKNRIDELNESIKFKVDCNSNLRDAQIPEDTKVLKLTSCESYNILNSDFASIINNSSWIFIVTMEGNLTEFEKISSFKLNQIERQLLLHIYDKDEEREGTFIARNTKLANSLQITKLAQNPNSKNYTIDGFLLHLATKEHHRRDKKFDYSNWIIQSLRNDCIICIRFAQLIDNRFMHYLKLYEDQIEDLKCDKNCFRSLLNVPFNFEFDNVTSEINDFLQDNYKNQLTKAKALALKIGQKITLDNFFNESKARMNLEGLSALAWSQSEFKIYNFLIRADFPYPQNYQREKSDKNLTFTEVDAFHKNIQDGNYEKVKEFMKSNKMLTFARNSNNMSALQVAFESEQFKIFSYLRTHGMMLSDINEMGKHYSQRSNLSEIKKKKIRQFNMKNVIKDDEINLVDRLMQQSTITFNRKKLSKEKLKLEIRKAFMDLNELVPDIMRVVAANDHFEMIFDFDNDVVDEIDPRQTNNAGSAFRNYALIASLNLMSGNKYDRDFVLSTIAHEIMHSAMGLIYENEMKPYALGDSEGLSEMTLIANQCRQLTNESSTIKSAFKDNDKNLHTELIARVPDMIVTYRNNQSKLKKRQKSFKSLFDFYENKIIKEIQAMHATMSAKIKVKQFNNWFGVVDLLHRLDEKTLTNYEDEEITMATDTKVQIFITNHVRSMLRKIYEKAMREKELVVFLKSSFTIHEYFKDALYEIDRIKADVLLVIYCDSNFLKLKEFQERVDGTTLERIIFVGKEDSKSELLKFDFKQKSVKIFP